ncbi:hypothetical protein ACFL5O_01835 [Myxococcota bacterium]
MVTIPRWASRFAHGVALAGPLLCACSSSQNTEAPIGPVVLALSSEELAVGQPLELSGENFIAPEKGWVDVTFKGEFQAEDRDQADPVEFTIPLALGDDGTLSWERFGAFRVPFGSGNEIGTFAGEVFATNRPFEDDTQNVEASDRVPASAALATSLKVNPSVVLMDARAVGEDWIADCKEPFTSAIGQIPYVFWFRAAGFEAKQFDYTFGPGFIQEGVTTQDVTHFSKPLLENDHAILVQFAPVPEHVDGFTTSISIQATADDGSVHELELPVVVRRPLQVYYTTPMIMAQLYEPEPVSGCTPGGQGGMDVSYSESHSETRARSVTNTQRQGWTTTYGSQFTETFMSAETEGTQQSKSSATTVTDTRSKAYTESTQSSESKTQNWSRSRNFNFTTSQTQSSSDTTSEQRTDTTSRELGVSGSATGTVRASVGAKAETNLTDWAMMLVPGGGQAAKAGSSLLKKAGASLLPDLDVGVQADVGWEASINVGAQYKLGRIRSETVGSSHTDSQGYSRAASFGSSATEGGATTQGFARSCGQQWGIAQTYAEANSFTTSRQQSQTRAYTEATARNESLAEALQNSVSIQETVSTTDTTAFDISGTIPAHATGVWYRQTTRLVRKGVVVAYDLCGNADVVGDVTLDDWTWAPNLAIGEGCPPPSDLPEPECFIEPCDGE